MTAEARFTPEVEVIASELDEEAYAGPQHLEHGLQQLQWLEEAVPAARPEAGPLAKAAPEEA